MLLISRIHNGTTANPTILTHFTASLCSLRVYIILSMLALVLLRMTSAGFIVAHFSLGYFLESVPWQIPLAIDVATAGIWLWYLPDCVDRSSTRRFVHCKDDASREEFKHAITLYLTNLLHRAIGKDTVLSTSIETLQDTGEYASGGGWRAGY